MRRYIETVKADVRRRMSPQHRQSVALILAELGNHVVTLYNRRKTGRSSGTAVGSKNDPGLLGRRRGRLTSPEDC